MRNLKLKINCFFAVLVFLMALPTYILANTDEHRDQQYWDYSLPRNPNDIPLKSYQGQRYQAVVPDTLDLAYHADNTINFFTRLISGPETDYCIYHLMHFEVEPAILEVGHGSNQNQNAKWSESIVLMRTMSGSTLNAEQDKKLISSIVRLTGKDGLCYVPVKDRIWATFDPVTEKLGKPYADMFGEGRQLRAYATWYQHDRNPLWKKLAYRKIDRLLEIAVKKGDTLYFKLGRGYSPWYVETGEGPVAALGDVGQVFDSLTGDSAVNMMCWMPQAAATWYKLTGYKPALELARGLAQYLYQDPVFYNRDSGKFHNVGTFFTHAMNSMLTYAIIAGDDDIAKWVKRGCDQFFDFHDSDCIGIAPMHPCDFGDMMQVACVLSRNGYGDYWETIERWMRNTPPSYYQYKREEIDAMKRRPKTIAGDPNTTASIKNWAYVTEGLRPYIVDGRIPLNKPLPPNLHQPVDATDRCCGAFRGAGCCQGNYTRGLYVVWDSIIEDKSDALKVNLLFNRASSWADIDSYLPYEGKVVVKVKVSRKAILVRIPQWVDKKQVAVTINDKTKSFTWKDDRYLKLDKPSPCDEIVITFPVRQYDVKTSFALAAGQRLGTFKLDYIALNDLSDDFQGRGPAGKLEAYGSGNNKGDIGLKWRWNETTGNYPGLDGESSVEVPLTTNWNQYLDTMAMPPVNFVGKTAVFLAVFTKTVTGDIAMGFVRNASWDQGVSKGGIGTVSQGQQLFKIKGTRLYIARFYDQDYADEDTGTDIVADQPQSLMIKVDHDGNVRYFYHNGPQRNPDAATWRDITPASSAFGNLTNFDFRLGYFGINSLGTGKIQGTVTFKANTIVDISNPAAMPWLNKFQKYRTNHAPTKTITRFASAERFIWD